MKKYLTAERLLSRGQRQASRGFFDDSIVSYDKALSIAPSYFQVLLYKALSLASKNDTNSAIKLLNDAIKLKPDNHALHLNLGILLFDCNIYQLALSSFDEALRLSPGNALIINYRYLASLALGNDIESSIAFLKEKYKYGNPDFQARLLLFCEKKIYGNVTNPTPLDSVAEHCAVTKYSYLVSSLAINFDGLLYQMKYLFRSDRKQAYKHFTLAQKLLLLNRTDAALIECDKALSCSSNCREIEDLLLSIYWINKDYAAFLNTLSRPFYENRVSDLCNPELDKDEQVTKVRDMQELSAMIAYANYFIGNKEKALEFIKLLEAAEPHDCYANYLIGYSYLDADTTKSIYYFKKALRCLDQNILPSRLTDIMLVATRVPECS